MPCKITEEKSEIWMFLFEHVCEKAFMHVCVHAQEVQHLTAGPHAPFNVYWCFCHLYFGACVYGNMHIHNAHVCLICMYVLQNVEFLFTSVYMHESVHMICKYAWSVFG